MHPGEDLARLDDAPRRAVAHRGELVAPRPVDAGEPKNMDRQAGAFLKHAPFRLGRHPAPPARRHRLERGGLIDPIARPIAIDAGRRQIADPVELPCPRRQHVAMMPEDRIALVVGRDRDKQMADPVKCRGRNRPGAVKSAEGEAIAGMVRRRHRVGSAVRAGDGEAARRQHLRQRGRDIAKPEAEELQPPLRHSARTASSASPARNVRASS